jgi:hypothetical protein
MRVFVADELVVRNDVATTVSKGDFSGLPAHGRLTPQMVRAARFPATGSVCRLPATGSKATAKQEVNVAVAGS